MKRAEMHAWDAYFRRGWHRGCVPTGAAAEALLLPAGCFSIADVVGTTGWLMAWAGLKDALGLSNAASPWTVAVLPCGPGCASRKRGRMERESRHADENLTMPLPCTLQATCGCQQASQPAAAVAAAAGHWSTPPRPARMTSCAWTAAVEPKALFHSHISQLPQQRMQQRPARCRLAASPLQTR
jgi:hypothetical protein